MLSRNFGLALKAPVNRLSRAIPCWLSTGTTTAEAGMTNLLEKELAATDVQVKDISGGCGSMFDIYVESPKFEGLSLVKQHKMVKEALKQEISEMHGLTLKTKASGN